ncbi:MAG: OmpA family protein, partial [Pseudomonadota bacterium]
VGMLLVVFLVSTRFGGEPQRSEPPAPATAPSAETPQPSVPPAPGPDFAKLLGDAALVSEKNGVVRFEPRSGRQFASGAASPSAELRPLVGRIAQALDRVPGAIVVAGHADALKPRSGSNQALSLARARAVAQIISGTLADPKRVSAEGKADAEPLAPNDSAANRARNRRVVIELRRAP